MADAATSPRAPERDRWTDAALLLGSAAVVGLAFALTPSDTAVSLGGHELPPLCLIKALTGQDCLGCGLTRSFTFTAEGQLPEAFERHRLGPPLFLLVAAQIPYRLWALLRPAGAAPAAR